MPRISALEITQAPAASQELLAAVQKKLGVAPNVFRTMAHSPAVLGAFLGFGQALGGGSIGAKLGEQIALTVAGRNECDYCASAHTVLGKGAGLSEGELACNLKGEATDPKVQAALTFANKVVENRGVVSDEDLQAVRAAGFSDAEVVEIIAHVSINIFTNYLNHIAGTDVDFPAVSASRAAA